MDFAKCTIDNKIYKAHEFEQFEASELAQKRRFLVCKECGGLGFFRKASKSGQAACFGARPHKDGCDLAAPENDLVDGLLTKEELAYLNSGNEIVVDFNYGTQTKIHVNTDEEDTSNRESKKGRHSVYNGIAPAKSHKGLSTFLKALIADKDYFKDSIQNIDLEGYTYKAKNLFKNFSELTKDYTDDIIDNKPSRRVASWGIISDANDSNDKNHLAKYWR
jgi:hypothetical protein